ncbi:DUF1361 domain-containing protein [Paenibacillus shirakamiensis]|nr:DUF1361 domain-containing protein [Paenibacillus shirakamiensis]
MLRSLKDINHLFVKLMMAMLLFIASMFCLGLGHHIRYTSGRQIYMFLNWNLFLAWLPILFAFLLEWIMVAKIEKELRIILLTATSILWLLFYPNAAYLLTDLLHPFAKYHLDNTYRFWMDIAFWYHLLLFFSVAIVGLFIGIFSLFLVQELVRRVYGYGRSWIFAMLVLGLSSFGIYLGRFIRWNSWDAIMHPKSILKQVLTMFTDIEELRRMVPFTGILFLILMISYSFIYGFSLLGRIQSPRN